MFIGRHQLGTLGALAAVVAITLGISLLAQVREVKTQTKAAVHAQEQVAKAQETIAKTQEKQDRLLDLLAGIIPVPAPASVPVIEGLEKAGEAVARATGVVTTAGAKPEEVATVPGIARHATIDLFDFLVSRQQLLENASDADAYTELLDMAWEMRRSEPQRARALVSVYLTERRGDREALQLRAAVNGHQGHYANMLADAEQMITIYRDQADGFLWQALAHVLLGQGEAADKDLDDAAQYGGSASWIATLRGLALLQTGQTTAGIASLSDALTESNDLVTALLARACGNYRLRDLPPAVADLSRVLKIEPLNADVWAARGDAYVAAQEFEAAAQDFATAIALGGESQQMQFRLIAVKMQLRNSQGETLAPDDTPDAPKQVAQPSSDTTSKTINNDLQRLARRLESLESARTRRMPQPRVLKSLFMFFGR